MSVSWASSRFARIVGLGALSVASYGCGSDDTSPSGDTASAGATVGAGGAAASGGGGTTTGSVASTGAGGASGAGGVGGGGTLPLSQLCDAFLTDVCTALMTCYGAPYCDLDHCRADQECLGMSALEAEIAAGWVTYDAAAAEACHEAFSADPCGFSFFLFVPTVEEVLAACPGVLVGKQAAGAPCASPVDCTPTTFCVDDTACPGTCTPWLEQGEPCQIGVGSRCDPSLSLDCHEGFCVPPWTAGDSCDDVTDCFPDLWCDLTAGVCAQKAGAGAACNDFGGPTCQDDLWCDSLFDTGVCQPKSGAGGTCLQDDNCQDPLTCLPTTGFPAPGVCGPPAGEGGGCDSFADCAAGFTCAATTAVGTCVPLPALGEPCTTAFGAPPCAQGLICNGATCDIARCPGEPCNDGQSSCVLAVCSGSTCQTLAKLGEACAQDGDCASDSCAGMVCVDPKYCEP